MDSQSSDEPKINRVDIAMEANKLLLQINEFAGGNPGERIRREDFYKKIGFHQQSKTQRRTVQYLLDDYLMEHKNFLARIDPRSATLFQITPTGFKHLHKILTTKTKSQKGFCAMWFDSSMESVWQQAIRPAIEETEHEAIRIDEQHFTDDINAQMIMLIRQSKFLIADLTGNRGGVYFEAGFAYGLGSVDISHWQPKECTSHSDERSIISF